MAATPQTSALQGRGCPVSSKKLASEADYGSLHAGRGSGLYGAGQRRSSSCRRPRVQHLERRASASATIGLTGPLTRADADMHTIRQGAAPKPGRAKLLPDIAFAWGRRIGSTGITCSWLPRPQKRGPASALAGGRLRLGAGTAELLSSHCGYSLVESSPWSYKRASFAKLPRRVRLP